MASGLPVIGSAIHGISEHVKSDKGIVVQPGDEKAFCDAVLMAMEGLSKFDKAKMHTYAKENFSYRAVAEQFDAIYQKVIQR